ncbi:hypothetical protein DFH08DRAFT_975676 [Mycena albidolilacea]|uniref:Uncharacterized protein n=1 Tax=Mycena albidolilacea TaxID=1033008 RepID=A0AAD6Z431_9AGAR|nr:hypothetical protein DFH08DRAFT_975676 [Mycena albidolilacea]
MSPGLRDIERANADIANPATAKFDPHTPYLLNDDCVVGALRRRARERRSQSRYSAQFGPHTSAALTCIHPYRGTCRQDRATSNARTPTSPIPPLCHFWPPHKCSSNMHTPLPRNVSPGPRDVECANADVANPATVPLLAPTQHTPLPRNVSPGPRDVERANADVPNPATVPNSAPTEDRVTSNAQTPTFPIPLLCQIRPPQKCSSNVSTPLTMNVSPGPRDVERANADVPNPATVPNSAPTESTPLTRNVSPGPRDVERANADVPNPATVPNSAPTESTPLTMNVSWGLSDVARANADVANPATVPLLTPTQVQHQHEYPLDDERVARTKCSSNMSTPLTMNVSWGLSDVARANADITNPATLPLLAPTQSLLSNAYPLDDGGIATIFRHRTRERRRRQSRHCATFDPTQQTTLTRIVSPGPRDVERATDDAVNLAILPNLAQDKIWSKLEFVGVERAEGSALGRLCEGLRDQTGKDGEAA